jgi:hypothetical protein
MVNKVKPNINSVEAHPQLSNKKHPVDGAPVGAGPLGAKYTYEFPSSELQSDDKGAFTLGTSDSRVESGNIMLAI